MPQEHWSYRTELVDGPSRAGSFEGFGKKLRLPVLFDIVSEVGPDIMVQRSLPLDTSWSGTAIEVEQSEEASGPWEDNVAGFLRRKGLDRLLGAVIADRRVITADGAPLPLKVPSLMHLLYPDPREFASALMSIGAEGPSGRPFYLPGIANGDNIESLIYLGCEVLDASGAHADAVEGIYYTMERSEKLRDLSQRLDPALLCGCPDCASGLRDAAALGRHNVLMMRRRLALSDAMLREGRLRTHVMGLLSGKPGIAALVRRMESGPDLPELAHTHRKDMLRPVTYRDDLRDPDFRLWAKRIATEYMPHPARRTLLLLPCSARKPYSRSRTHQRIKAALSSIKGWRNVCQQVVVTSPLGAVPMELDMLYPPAYYDIPVTGEWYPEEVSLMRGQIASICSRASFSDIVCHHLEGGVIFEEEARTGRMGAVPFHLASDEDSLREVMGPIVDRDGSRAVNGDSADACSLLRFALGADVPWDAELSLKRGYDRTDIRLGRSHIAELKKGGPVPSLEGGRILWQKGWSRKAIIDDFVPKGTVFAQGVLKVTGIMRAGDIVLVGTEDEFRGVGRAIVPGKALSSSVRGNAIRMISHIG